MQNKGAISFFAILFAVVSLFQLSFTFFTKKVERNAKEYALNETTRNLATELAKGDQALMIHYLDSISKVREKFYLDSMSNETIYNILIKKYTYKDCKERELNLGLDLKGGMNVTLEISVPDIIRSMSGYSKDPTFNKALAQAIQMQTSSERDFVTLFGEAFEQVDPNARLAAIFSTYELRDVITPASTNEEVLELMKKETDGAIDRSFNILRTRIDRFGVTQPNIQKLQTTGRILVELPGIKEPERVRKLLQGTAKLEFWETYEYKEIHNYIEEANKRAASLLLGTDTLSDKGKTEVAEEKSVETPQEEKSLVERVSEDTTGAMQPESERTFEQYAKENPLFAYLRPSLVQDEQGNYYPSDGPVVGYAAIMDTARIGRILRMPQVAMLFPRDLRFIWTVKPVDKGGTTLQLIAIKTNRDGKAPIAGDKIVDARQDFSQSGASEITMMMNPEGARVWKRLTADNIGKSIAIVLDGYAYSFPTVQGEIPNGRSSITGNFSIDEAKDLANILKAGKMPAPAHIVEEAVVGPSLGREAINAGLISFLIAFALVLVYMLFYYNRAGYIADLALLTNIFFLFGVLASLQAVLTLPGIAGIVLTLGMAVDANVIIYERIREELRAGKGLNLAITDGYKNAYSAIIDGNVTTLLTGIVLYIFGSGPVQGFATTLIIGICTSLFSAIFISRLIFAALLGRKRKITFDNRITRSAFLKAKFDFIGSRKLAVFISGALILAGIISLSVRGLNMGVDFSGGRTFVVRFDQPVKTNELRSSLFKVIGETPEVKTFGPSNQVKITTKYLIDETGVTIDSLVEAKVFEGIKDFFKDPVTFQDFTSDDPSKVIGRLSSQLVGPTIADDIKRAAVFALLFALIIIFVYIAIRFKKWQYGMGGLVALFHDAFITISVYSLFSGILPFNLEVDQAFIAAILTIIGYSINDTVIIFDRIRENNTLFPKRDSKQNINDAINVTLGRTINTAGTTLVVLLAIFLLGGEVIRGFAFALMVGVTIGTYSSWFVATPVAYVLARRSEKKTLAKK